MARRRSPARRSTARKRPSRRRRGTGGIPLWFAALVAAVFAMPLALAFLRSAWMPVAAGAAVLGLLVVAVVLAVRRMGAAYRRHALRRADLDRLDPRRFEELAAELLRRDGFRKVRVVGGAGDGGVDVLGVSPDGRPYALQCKRYSRHVGPGAVRDFVGALQSKTYQDHRGVLVTSNYLSAQATRTAREHDMLVIDRDRLADWLLDAFQLAPGRRTPAWLARLRPARTPDSAASITTQDVPTSPRPARVRRPPAPQP